MANIGPLFAAVKQTTKNLFTEYTNQELIIILDYIANCNRMIQEMTYKMKDKTVLDRKNTTAIR
jgi:hypothetical protein